MVVKRNDILKRYSHNGYQVYEMEFKNLITLYDYLSNSPPLNTRVWNDEVSSMRPENEFSGVSLEKAIEYCLYGYTEKYDLFLSLQRHLDNVVLGNRYSDEYETSFVGSRYNLPNLIAGNPKNRYHLTPSSENRFVTIHFNLGYPQFTSKQAILNRGVITLNLIKLLEMNNYQVDFKAYELSECGSEMIYISVLLKKAGELLDVKKCFFPLTSREFLRRILFRVLESLPVKNAWDNGYGQALDVDEMRVFLNIPNSDIVISYPNEHGIKGSKEIYRDAYDFFKSIKLDENIDMDEIKRMLKRKI